jgi:hypothetical protein
MENAFKTDATNKTIPANLRFLFFLSKMAPLDFKNHIGLQIRTNAKAKIKIGLRNFAKIR